MRLAHGLALAIACLSLLFGCGSAAPPPSIIFPADGSSFAEDAAITLMADAEVVWESDLDGHLASGSRVTVSLSPGRHRITIKDPDGREDDALSLSVRAVEFSFGSAILIHPTVSGVTRSLPAGTFLPAAASWCDQSLQWEMNAVSKALPGVSGKVMPSVPPRPGIPALPSSLKELRGASPTKAGGRASKSLDADLSREGDIRVWRMADPAKGTGEPGFLIEARLEGILGDLEIWIDREDAPDEAAMDEFLRLGLDLSLPRAMGLWGRGPEPDGDGRLAVLMSGRLNGGGIAIGFFNPCDFFPPSDDPLSPDYNPTSNGRDAVYLGLPVADEPWFSPASLAATLAHEYQHLTRFGFKTWASIEAGADGADQEDPPFDEGMAHLTESLVGLGCSGGNALFALRYLSEAGAYSLRGRDADGAQDSAGKRGACALFFSWLLDRSGGISWKTEDPVCPEPGPALSLLRASLVPGRSGWDSISEAAGMGLERLFRDFSASLNGGGLEADRSPIDPLTGEPTRLSAYMGDFSFGGREFRLAGPLREEGPPEGSLLPWSCRFFSPWSLTASTRATFTASQDPGARLVLEFLMIDGD